jgi:hypothetical protein
MPAWLIEISTDPDQVDSKASQIFQLLGQHGYWAHWFDGERLNKRRPGDRTLNYWFLTPEHLETLRRSGMSVRDDAYKAKV